MVCHAMTAVPLAGHRHSGPGRGVQSAAPSQAPFGKTPSCNTLRIVELAAHLTDHVSPPLPVCQSVLAVRKRLRYFLERDANL